MKKTLLSAFTVALSTVVVTAQTFNPSASALPGGTLGEAYSGTVINFTIPSTTQISGSVVESAIIDAYPQAATVIGFLGLASQTFDMTVSSTTLAVEGLPNGVDGTCDATPCTYVANASGSITISGTPTQAGNFTVNITSLTSGEADLSAYASQLSGFGIPSSFAIPQPVPGALDENGYTMAVTDPNGIEEANKLFSLGFYPNPTSGDATLDVNSIEGGVATVEIYSITGALVVSTAETIRVGANRIAIDMNGIPSGIYLIKADINGEQALIRTQKI